MEWGDQWLTSRERGRDRKAVAGYAAQLGEHLLCKQPALNAVVYRTGPLLKTPQLSAVMKRLKRVQFHHQSRCLNDLQDAIPAR